MSLVLRSGKEIAPMSEVGPTNTAVEQGKSEMIDSWLTDVGESHSGGPAGNDRQSDSPDKATANGLGRPFWDHGEAERDRRADGLEQEPEVTGLGRPDSLQDHGVDVQIIELADVGPRGEDLPQVLGYMEQEPGDRPESRAGSQIKNEGAVGAVGARSHDARSSVSQSSRSTSASSCAALAKAEKLVAEQRLLQLKNAQERRLKRLQLEFEQEQAEALEFAELAAIRARVLCGEEPAASVHASSINRRSGSDPFQQPVPALHANDGQQPNTWTFENRRMESQTRSPCPNPSYLRSKSETSLERGTFRAAAQDTLARSAADQIVMGMEALSTRMSLPPLEATKFAGDPAEYGRFVHRFNELVHSSCLTESQKMSRLLQFVEGKAKGAIKGYEGVPHGYRCALDVLKRRFGEPHMIADACVSRLTCEQTLSKNDYEGLQVFADEVRTSYETLSSMDALGEMNSTNLRRLAGRLSIPDQAKWRDEAQRRRARGELPDFKCLVEFIERRAAAVNDPVFGNTGQHTPRDRRAQTTPPNPPRQRVTTMTTAITNKTTTSGDKKPAKCPLCNKPHQLDACAEYVSKNPHQRKQILMEKKLCLNCLRPGHFVGSCRSKPQCRDCDQKHHSSIHKERPAIPPPSATDDSAAAREVSAERSTRDQGGVASKKFSAACMSSKAATPKTVMLQVQAVKIMGHNGEQIPTYALLDSGSEATFISRDLADRLRLPFICDGPVTICTLGGERVISSRKIDITVKPFDDESTCKLEPRAQVLNDLVVDTANPQSLDPTAWPHLHDIKLPHLDCDNIGLIIGADIPEAHLQEERRVGLRNEPMAIRTMLGWTFVGPVGEKRSKRISSNLLMRVAEDNTLPLDLTMERFMNMDRLDAPGPEGNKLPSIGDQRVLAQMEETTELLNGRYAVGMLWKDELTTMPNNRPQAEARLRGLERKLRRESETHRKYSAFIDKLLMEGYARQLTTQEVESRTDKTWYLPHHAVIHPKKGKLRVVFDAAAKFQGKSLNSQLAQGPDLTNNLLGVLLRFRQGPVAMMADIEAMFHQVEVPQTDSDALRFLWWSDGDLDRKPATFKMLRHIFGATDSPCCANFALKKTARDHAQDFSKESVETVQRDFYVDDLLKSVDSTKEGALLASELVRLLEKGGFNLTKWSSNNREVLRSIPAQDRVRPDVDLALGELPEERALGVQWRTESDELIITATDVERPTTKHGALSTLSSVYDPIGLVCPVVLHAKLIVQQLWKGKVEWDDELPEELSKEWQLWKEELTHLGNLQFPRCYHIVDPSQVVDMQLHLFSDASENAYGACAYLRVVYLGRTAAHVCLVAGKARTAPLRPLSIPRLELQAAVLAVRLFHLLTLELTLAITRTTFWTDSQTTLQYIKNETKGFLPFVAHRVAEIRQSSSPSQWRHCPGKLNPADLASRGLRPSAFLKQKVWFDGPEFLRLPEVEWPAVQDVAQVPDDNPEIKRRSLKVHHTEIKSDRLIDMIEAHSSWQKLQRSAAWLLRFCDWVKSRKSANTNTVLDQHDYNRATLAIVRVVQRHQLSTELSDLRSGKSVLTSSKISDLKPFLDESGVMRVGGRLDRAPALSFSERHPLILPKGHVGDLIVRQYHQDNAHAGREQTLAATREMFWIVSGRSLSKEVVRHCVTCRRLNARPLSQEMAPLPTERLIAYRPPFTTSGVDYFGPMSVKLGRSTAKRWGCLFTCFSTRAVHLEVAHSLETDDFILVLRRFISRRGSPRELWSDHGTNFVGAERELREALLKWNQEKINKELQQRSVRWVFQPPAAPHMSGVWERLVGCAKKHLKAVVGSRLLRDDSLNTLMVEVESVLNSRPLTALSDDPRDLEPLTPNHFLLQRAALSLPPGLFVKEDVFSRKQWRQIQVLTNTFWERWQREYLSNLQRRQVNRAPKRNLKVDDLVLVVSDQPRLKWSCARVQRVFPGQDGLVRSAVVKTANGLLHRPVTKLCILEAS